MKRFLCLVILGASFLGANELESKCYQGDFDICEDLWTEYFNSKNYKEAIDLLTKTCNNEYALGCYHLGFLYSNELVDEIQINIPKAKEFFNKACNLGLQTGCDEYKKLNMQGN